MNQLDWEIVKKMLRSHMWFFVYISTVVTAILIMQLIGLE